MQWGLFSQVKPCAVPRLGDRWPLCSESPFCTGWPVPTPASTGPDAGPLGGPSGSGLLPSPCLTDEEFGHREARQLPQGNTVRQGSTPALWPRDLREALPSAPLALQWDQEACAVGDRQAFCIGFPWVSNETWGGDVRGVSGRTCCYFSVYIIPDLKIGKFRGKTMAYSLADKHILSWSSHASQICAVLWMHTRFRGR